MNNTQSTTLIIGSGGRLGQDLLAVFSNQNVIGLDRKALDLSNLEEVRDTISKLEFDRVIITASLTAVDYCEDHEEESFLINAEAPGVIAEVAAAKGAHTTYISTDFVFDGQASAPICEDALPNPLSVYGASKLAGEQRVLEASLKNLVGRVSWLYGPHRPAFPEWILGKAETEKALSLPSDKVACPTSSLDVATTLKQLLEKEETPASGIYNVCNSGNCTWQEWGQACLDIAVEFGAKLKTSTIEANSLNDITAFKAERPAFSALDNSKLAKFLGTPLRPWQEALRAHLARAYNEAQPKVTITA